MKGKLEKRNVVEKGKGKKEGKTMKGEKKKKYVGD